MPRILCTCRAIEERETARLAALTKAEMAKAVFEEVRQASSDVERKRLRKEEENRRAVRQACLILSLSLSLCLSISLSLVFFEWSRMHIDHGLCASLLGELH